MSNLHNGIIPIPHLRTLQCMNETTLTPPNSPVDNAPQAKPSISAYENIVNNSPVDNNEVVRTHETTCWKDCSHHFPRCLLSESNTEESRWCLITYLSNHNNYLKFISNYNELGYNWGYTHIMFMPIVIDFDDTMEEVDSSDNDSAVFDSHVV